MDDKQQELIRDNLELKELCLYLDEERANVAASVPNSCTNCGAPVRPTATTSTGAPLRDDGDGSSSSTNDEPMPSVQQFDRTIPVTYIRLFFSDPLRSYQFLMNPHFHDSGFANTINAERPNAPLCAVVGAANHRTGAGHK